MDWVVNVTNLKFLTVTWMFHRTLLVWKQADPRATGVAAGVADKAVCTGNQNDVSRQPCVEQVNGYRT